MSYRITSLEGSGKEIVRRIMAADENQLLIPPKYEESELEISSPPKGDKYIGLFSSGTTGTAKCIWNKYDNLILNAQLSAQAFEVDARHFLLMMALPWHVAGLSWLLMAELMNCEYVFITTKKGDHELWTRTVQDLNPDYLFTVPAVLRALYDEEWYAGNIVFGGYPIRFEEYPKLSPRCFTMYQAYGQTEAGGLISCYKRRSTKIPSPKENLCHGFPVSGATIECDGTSSDPKPILLKSQTAFKNSTYDTSDIGYKDSEGRIYVLGRKEEIGMQS